MFTEDDETSLRLFGSRTYAQHGEDILFAMIFDRLGIVAPSYLDIGAFHPTAISNTHLLYLGGSRGINVEANPALMPLFHERRPEDLNLNCAVGVTRQSGKRFYVAENPGMSSFAREVITCPVVDEIDVPVWTIPDILIGHRDGKWPDLLSIDIEGGDVEVLESCLPSGGDRPAIVCAEACAQGGDVSDALRKLMVARNYFVFGWARANMVFVSTEHEEVLR